MAVTLGWADGEHKTLVYQVEGDWAWSELYTAVRQAHGWMDQLDYRVHYIVDLRKAGMMREEPIWPSECVVSAAHHNADWTVFVGAPPLMRALFNALRRVRPEAMRRVSFADTLDDAQCQLSGRERLPAI